MMQTTALAHNKDKRFLPELDKYDFPGEVKSKAREIYTIAFTKATRGVNRKRAIFFCIFNAYIEHGMSPDPQYIGYTIGLDKKEFSRAKKCNTKPYCPGTFISSPIDFLDTYCAVIDSNLTNLDVLKAYSRQILEKYPELQDMNPQNVAAALVFSYFNLRYRVHKEKYANSVHISWPTLQKILGYIEE